MSKYVGVDISKDDFEVAIPDGEGKGNFTTKKLDNNESGVKKFIEMAEPDWHVIVEATGVYSLLLSHELSKAGIAVSVINPRSSSHFAKAANQSAKTDKMDAKGLSNYGRCMQPDATELPDEDYYAMKQKRLYIKHLQKSKQRLGNVLHSLEIHPFQDESTVENIKKEIGELDAKLKVAEKELQDFTKSIFGEQYKLLTSIKGIGPKTAIVLIYATNGFRGFVSPKQFTRFIGISPTVYQSGSSVRRKGRMNRSGDPEVRRLLYIATWSAIRYNKACKKKYEELLAKGKPSMVALVAVMNKLVRQAFGVIQNGQKFDNDYEENLAAEKQAA